MPTYLDFEQPIQELIEQIEKTEEIRDQTGANVDATLKELQDKLKKAQTEIFESLSPWQRVQLSRHPDRPYTLEYIEALTGGDFAELHGDRNVKDDKAMVGGFGSIDGKSYMFIGQQKGVNTKMRQYRNFG
ncbi:MAG: acetyl-CoA carboxylase carboxyl transferase subunit alpha, partial [Sphingobacteriales bacterium]